MIWGSFYTIPATSSAVSLCLVALVRQRRGEVQFAPVSWVCYMHRAKPFLQRRRWHDFILPLSDWKNVGLFSDSIAHRGVHGPADGFQLVATPFVKSKD